MEITEAIKIKDGEAETYMTEIEVCLSLPGSFV